MVRKDFSSVSDDDRRTNANPPLFLLAVNCHPVRALRLLFSQNPMIFSLAIEILHGVIEAS